ncbi:MAG: hypothetical protein V1822_00935 [Candidatus Micrarchaeota archaeon]
MEIIEKTIKRYKNGDKAIIDIIRTEDPAFECGIKFNLAYLSYDERQGKYQKLFSMDNSHGPPHLHRLGRKGSLLPYGWQKALSEFKLMVFEHRKRTGVD